MGTTELMIGANTQKSLSLPEDVQFAHRALLEKCRFFMIKSYTKDNIEVSQKMDEWATTVPNQRKLDEAFSQGNVCLIFSVNRTNSFHGYALMTSHVSDKVSNHWTNDYNIKLGGVFSVQWICVCEMPFNKAKHLTNPINNHEQVTKGRDTQEIASEVGVVLSHMCFEHEKQENTLRNKQPYYDNNNLEKLLGRIEFTRNHRSRLQNLSSITGGDEINNSKFVDSLLETMIDKLNKKNKEDQDILESKRRRDSF